METYDVALWLSWPSLFPDYVEDIAAFDHVTAVGAVMQRYNLSRVIRAAVAHKGVIRRYWRVVVQPQEQEVMR